MSLHRSGVGVSKVWIVLVGCGTDVSPLWVHLTVSVLFGPFVGLDIGCDVVCHRRPVYHIALISTCLLLLNENNS